MPALRLMNALAGRGLSLSLEGTRLRSPRAGLLTDEDRRLIRPVPRQNYSLCSRREQEHGQASPVLRRPYRPPWSPWWRGSASMVLPQARRSGPLAHT